MYRFVVLLVSILFPLFLSYSQPVVLVKYENDPEGIERDVRHHMDHLNIRENIHLTIRFTRQIFHGMWGMTFCLDTQQPNGYRHIVICIDSRLTSMRQKMVLAHEMIHVKQYAKGELIAINKRKLIWKGRKYKTGIYSKKSPWETEAYKMERRLIRSLRDKNTTLHTRLAANL